MIQKKSLVVIKNPPPEKIIQFFKQNKLGNMFVERVSKLIIFLDSKGFIISLVQNDPEYEAFEYAYEIPYVFSKSQKIKKNTFYMLGIKFIKNFFKIFNFDKTKSTKVKNTFRRYVEMIYGGKNMIKRC